MSRRASACGARPWLLKKVNHPGVCGIVDMELDDTLAFIVTELIEGQ